MAVRGRAPGIETVPFRPIESRMMASEAAFEALVARDCSADRLKRYAELFQAGIETVLFRPSLSVQRRFDPPVDP